ncbi:hypothetical protein [Streptomyces bauhiniae]
MRRLRPRSLRSRFVLIAALLATGAVLLCQLVGLTVLRGWRTDPADGRLAHPRPRPGLRGRQHGHGAPQAERHPALGLSRLLL